MTLTITEVRANALAADPDNVRQSIDKASVKDLAASIAAEGLLSPLEVRPSSTGKGYVIVSGHRRHAAICQLIDAGTFSPNSVWTVIVRDDVTVADGTVAIHQLIENLQRVDLDPIEEALGYQRVVGMGMSQKELARRVGRSAPHVSKRLALLGLPAQAGELLKKGTLTVEMAVELTKVQDQDWVTKALDGLAGGNRWNATDLDDIRRQLQDEARDAEEAKVRAQLVKAGFPVYTRQELSDSYQTALAALPTDGKDHKVTYLDDDSTREFLPGQLGEGSVTDKDTGVYLAFTWQAGDRVLMVRPVHEVTSLHQNYGRGTTPTGAPGEPHIDASKEAQAVTKATNAHWRDQDALIIAGGLPKAEVADLVHQGLRRAVGQIELTRACKVLGVDMVESHGAPAPGATIDAEIAAGGARAQRAWAALAICALDPFEQHASDTVVAWRKDHKAEPFPAKEFRADWRAKTIKRLTAKVERDKAAAQLVAAGIVEATEAGDEDGVDDDGSDLAYEGGDPAYDGE